MLYIIIMDLGFGFNAITKGLVIKMEGSLFGIENGRRSFTSSSVKEGIESIKSKLDFFSNEQNAPFMTSFFIELIGGIKNTLGTIRNYTQISRGKFSDKEFGEYFYRAVTEDVEKMDIVLNGLINYIKLNTPIRKIDTVHHLIEEVLKKHQSKLEEKGIKIFKRFENAEEITMAWGFSPKFSLPATIFFPSSLRREGIVTTAVASVAISWNLTWDWMSWIGTTSATPSRFSKFFTASLLSFDPFSLSAETSSARRESDVVIVWRSTSCRPYPKPTRNNIAPIPIPMPKIVRTVRPVLALNIRVESLIRSLVCILLSRESRQHKYFNFSGYFVCRSFIKPHAPLCDRAV